jgi:hypothetical protein
VSILAEGGFGAQQGAGATILVAALVGLALYVFLGRRR